ncbi:MAG: SURF1 family protein [Burkholderiales bacterium]|nr:SURF1 family protein [Burkholderiales bacterium]
MLSLANWQLSRAAEKAGRQESLEKLATEPAVRVPGTVIDPADFEFRKVEVSGKFEPRHTIYLDNKTLAGKVGFEIVTPLRIDGTERYVLINRGWVAANPKRDNLPAVAAPSGTVLITGTAVVPSKKILELSEQTGVGAIRQNLVLERYRETSGLDVQPIVIQQTSAADDGLQRRWARPDAGIAKHQGYAFQWFALALTIAVLYLVLNVKKCSIEAE